MRPRLEPAVALALLLLATGTARAGAPDLPGAGRALLAAPFDVAGDVVAGIGLLGASLIAAGGDAVALIDHNRWTTPVLRGFASTTVHAVAFALAWGSTRTLELLRLEDIERLPEPAAAYFDGAPFAGRFDGAASGVSALALGVDDLWSGPALGLLRAVGARGHSDALEQASLENRIRALGPEPLGEVPAAAGTLAP